MTNQPNSVGGLPENEVARLRYGNREGEYALATGAAAVRRLAILHQVCSPVGREILLRAGLKRGMRVADFGCGMGAVTRMMAEIVGPTGSVTGIDVSAGQLREARRISESEGFRNVTFVEADACATGLPRNSFDLVYCRFLLLHLPNPGSCLGEMHDVLRPGGVLVVEDGDLASAGSLPATALDAFANLFSRLGPLRGLDYSLANNLHQMVKAAGFPAPEIETHQPAISEGEGRFLLKMSVEEAGPAFVKEGIITAEELEQTLCDMQAATEDPRVVVLGPRMSLVWARKPAPETTLWGEVQ